MNKVKVFENSEFGQLEILWIEDKAYFPAVRCAEILGYSNPRKAVRDHCKEVTIRSSLTNGGKQGKKYISEGNLYRLIVKSKLPKAVEFESWVFDTIMPSVRKYGFYATDSTLDDFLNNPDHAIRIFQEIKDEREKVEKLTCENEKLSEKATYLDKILQSKTAIPITVIAKDYGISAIAMNIILHELRVQYRLKSGTWVLYQEYASCGYTKSVTFQYDENKTSVQTLWTQKGRRFLYNILLENGYLPLCERIGGEIYS